MIDPNNTRNEDGSRIKMSMEAMMGNGIQLMNFRTLCVGIVCGVICGILGLTSLHGLLFYLLSSILTDFIVVFYKMKMNTKEFTNTSFVQFYIDGLSNSAMTFVLFWTLSFAIVYIY